ncbi:hypothetical protein GF324_04000 [bacterium]|nr:hypothetical protein [bacterium]
MNRRRSNALILLILLFSAAVSPCTAQITETGSFRAFMLGEEPNTAYDNWLSHTVEGLAVEGGYNVHMPPELDPQTNGFGTFMEIPEEQADTARSNWRAIFRALIMDDPEAATALFQAMDIPYEWVYFNDTETGQTFRMLRETIDSTFIDSGDVENPDDDVIGSFTHGWGLFVYNPNSTSPEVSIQCVHPNDDYISVPLAVDLFAAYPVGALVVNGTGREAAWSGSSYSNGRSLSDPSRNCDLPIAWWGEFFADTLRARGYRELAIQIHSYDHASHPDYNSLQISPGPDDGYSNRPVYDRSGDYYDWINYLPTICVPANAIVLGQPDVPAHEYVAVWQADGLVHNESREEISGYIDLPGYGSNCLMESVAEGRHPRESRDSFLHVEFDELPDVLADLELTELQLYNGPVPPNMQNWQLLWTWYESAIDALAEYLQDTAEVPDTQPPEPTTPARVTYASDTFAVVRWERGDDADFFQYEVYYDTLEVTLNSPVWDSSNDSDLVDMGRQSTNITDLAYNRIYGFRTRSVDHSGNASPLSELVQATTVDTTLPEVRPTPPVTLYPAGAWPPVARVDVKSFEPIQSVVLRSFFDGSPGPDAVLHATEEYVPDTWIRYEGPFPSPPGGVQSGMIGAYAIDATESTQAQLSVTVPDGDPWEFVVLTGQHMLNLPLETSDGGLEDPDDVWQWGYVEQPPGGGYDGSNAWHTFEAGTDETGALACTQDISIAGMPHPYLSFRAWYDTRTVPNRPSRVYSGGIVEVSTDSGSTWQEIEPLIGYPRRMLGGAFDGDYVFGGSSEGWRREIFRLAPFLDAGSIRFRFTYYQGDDPELSRGWVVDNIRVTSMTPQVETVSNILVRRMGNSLRINWNDVGADVYRIFRGENPYEAMDLIETQENTVFTDPDIFAGPEVPQKLFYRVEAVLW